MDIGSWYLPTMLVQDDATLEKRKKATATVVAAIQPKQVIELAKVALGMAYTATVIDEVMKAYTTGDEGFNAATQSHATEILVDCILAQLMETPRGNGTVAALAILCGTGIIDRTPKHHAELVSLANDVCGAGMTAAMPAPPKLAKLRAKITDQITPLKAEVTSEQIAAALKPVFTAAAEDQREDAKFSEDLLQTLKAQQQQIDILWWMLGEWSDELNAPFGKVPVAAAPIIAGLELAGLVVTREIPRSAKAVLHKVLAKAGDIDTKESLIEAVNGCPRDWREKAGLGDLPREIQYLTPILLALQSSLTTNSKDTWQPVFEKLVGVTKFAKSERIDIAVQVFRELLLWQMTI